jgi:hypothetical protein
VAAVVGELLRAVVIFAAVVVLALAAGAAAVVLRLLHGPPRALPAPGVRTRPEPGVAVFDAEHDARLFPDLGCSGVRPARRLGSPRNGWHQYYQHLLGYRARNLRIQVI